MLEEGAPASLSPRQALQWRQEVSELLKVDEAVERLRYECRLVTKDGELDRSPTSIARQSRMAVRLGWHAKLTAALSADLRTCLGLNRPAQQDSSALSTSEQVDAMLKKLLADRSLLSTSEHTPRGSLESAWQGIWFLSQVVHPAPRQVALDVVPSSSHLREQIESLPLHASLAEVEEVLAEAGGASPSASGRVDRMMLLPQVREVIEEQVDMQTEEGSSVAKFTRRARLKAKAKRTLQGVEAGCSPEQAAAMVRSRAH